MLQENLIVQNGVVPETRDRLFARRLLRTYGRKYVISSFQSAGGNPFLGDRQMCVCETYRTGREIVPADLVVGPGREGALWGRFDPLVR